MSLKDEYLDVLMNLESNILRAFVASPGLRDADVLDAVEALITSLTREQQGRRPKPAELSLVAEQLHRTLEQVGRWQLGQAQLPATAHCPMARDRDLTMAELLYCLKRVRKSIRLWSAADSPQGYLQFLSANLPSL